MIVVTDEMVRAAAERENPGLFSDPQGVWEARYSLAGVGIRARMQASALEHARPLLEAGLAAAPVPGPERGEVAAFIDDVAGVSVGDRVADALLAWVRERERVAAAAGWDRGVATALDFAILNPDGITLRLEKTNPYRDEKVEG